MIIKRTQIPAKPRSDKLINTGGPGTTISGKTETSQYIGSSHEHANKSVLDSITEEMLDNANRGLLTTDSETEASDDNIYSALRTDKEIKDALDNAGFDDKYISKIYPDFAAGLITFLKGLIALDDSEFTNLIASGRIQANDIDVTNRLLTSVLKVVVQAEIQDILLKGQLNSESFTSGFLGHGMRLRQENGEWGLELDKLTVRKTMTIYEMVVQQVIHQGGQHIYSPAGAKLTSVTDGGTYWRCEHDGSTDFITGSQVLCQIFNAGPRSENPDGSLTFGGVNVKRYWRLCTSFGPGWFNLSKTDMEIGSGYPETGDYVAVLGHRTNPEWQNAMMLTSAGSGAPYLAYYSGINSYSLEGKETIREGNLDGIVDPDFGQLRGYGLYAQNVFLKGVFRLQNNKTIEEELNRRQQSNIGAFNLLREYDARFDLKYWGQDGDVEEVDFNDVELAIVRVLADDNWLLITEDNLVIKLIL